MKNLKFLQTFVLTLFLSLSFFPGYAQTDKMDTFSLSTIALFLACIVLFGFFMRNYRKTKLLSKSLAKKNKELQLAKEESDKLAAVKTKFTSTVSHELRTPLYGVIGLSSILMEKVKEEENQRYIKLMKFSADHLLNLINDVLQVTKMEAYEISLDQSSYDIQTIANNIKNSFEYQSEKNGNTLHLNFDSKIPNRLIGDPVRLTQIILNLVSNANKFTKNGDIWLNFKDPVIKGDKVDITFEVKDNGQGIPLDKQKIIFEKFSHTNSDANHSTGTGLGLNIAQSLANLFGGEIKLNSELGKGSTFFFTITFDIDESIVNSFKEEENTTANTIEAEVKNPMDQIKVEDAIADTLKSENDQTADEIKEVVAITDPSDLKILIVEDNKINQIVTQKILKSKGYESEIAEDGLIAVDMVSKKNYSIILMDLNMPNMDGIEATKKIREFNTHTPIIALTASDTEEIADNIQDTSSGFNDYLKKPFKNEEFFEKIEYYTSNNGAISQAS